MVELAEEAKEYENEQGHLFGYYPLMKAELWEGMEVVMARIQRAWAGSVNSEATIGVNAIAHSVSNCSVDKLRTLATMGTDLSKNTNVGSNVFDIAMSPRSTDCSPDKISAIFKALSEHGVTSRNIPPGFQSPHYFRSIYYQNNVRTQRWINRSLLILSTNKLFKWSVENQIASEFHRTLPPNLTGVGHFVAHCFFDVAGGDFGNGIARLITEFYGGFDESRAKSPFALIGMPAYGKHPDTAARCSACRAQAVAGKKWLRCCGKVGYCSKECQLVDWKKTGHKKCCERNKAIART
jgi:hypothetical protein